MKFNEASPLLIKIGICRYISHRVSRLVGYCYVQEIVPPRILNPILSLQLIFLGSIFAGVSYQALEVMYMVTGLIEWRDQREEYMSTV